MTTVTLADAQANLAELLRRAAAGEQIVITDGETVVGSLGGPPVAMTPYTWSRPAEEEAALIARREALVREWLGVRADAPVPRPEGMTHDEYLARYRKAA